MKSYGITNQVQFSSEVDFHIENLKIKGFSLAKNILDISVCDKFNEKLENIYQQQEGEFGKDKLAAINELDMVRMPFLEDESFFELFTNELALELATKTLGKVFHLHLQNGVINRPQKEHHQTSWHRDLPYQDWTSSKSLGFNAFYCLTDFTFTNGATFVLPYSHRLDYFPSSEFVEENQVQITAPKGSILFFDSMLYHRAGINSSEAIRYGINTMFVVPIIKQQIDIASHFADKDLSPKLKELLGVSYQIPSSVKDFRNRRIEKNKKI